MKKLLLSGLVLLCATLLIVFDLLVNNSYLFLAQMVGGIFGFVALIMLGVSIIININVD